jgi:hypothetical protein
MLYSLAEAAKKTGFGEFTILRAIEDGRIAGTKDLFGEWHVDEEDLRGFELAAAEHGVWQATGDSIPNSHIAALVSADNYQQKADAPCDSINSLPALIGASGRSRATGQPDAPNVSLELHDSRRISIRLAKPERGVHSGLRWDNEIRPDERDKISDSVPYGRRWQIRSIPLKGIALIALGWIGGLTSYHFFDQAMTSQRKVKVSDQSIVYEKQVSRADRAKQPGTENGGRFASKIPSSGFERPHRPLTQQRQAQQRSVSKPSADEDPETTQSTITKQQDRAIAPAVPFPETRPASVSGWTLRSVVDGTAVLDGPYGSWKVVRGDVVPGLGRVDSIVLWGSRWIVATSRGLVTTP